MSAKSVQVVIPKGTKLHIEGHHVEFQSEVKVLAHPDPADGSTNEALTRAIAQVNGTASPRAGYAVPPRSTESIIADAVAANDAAWSKRLSELESKLSGKKPEPVAEKK